MSDRLQKWDSRLLVTRALAVLGVLLLLVAPLYLEEFWLRLGFTACGAAIGALGLNILTGAAGQLSLAHAFFLAVGAVTYSWLAGDPDPAIGPTGLGWPPVVAMAMAIVVTAAVGLLVSPISSRLSGLYLGIASLALVFIGQHLLATLSGITGGFQGRSAPTFSVFGFEFSNQSELLVLGVPFGRYERLWYLGLLLLAVSAWAGRNLLKSRHGRAFRMIRDKELAAAVSGISVRRGKQNAFVVSSALAGLSGALFAIAIGSIAPVSFSLDVSIQYLVMIVIGGMGTVTGSILGAAVVTALPILTQRYGGVFPLVGDVVSPAAAARYLYGGALIAVLMLQPRGLAAVAGLVRRRAPSNSASEARPIAGGRAPVDPPTDTDALERKAPIT
ncbi:branched-chain amino acid ABC transporter permease [Blastococcus tunisiensis]|uniref:Amino acid/amide ABC transporter membrane protein 2, HAAT family n=1 Tax=Blastococcus tunisiensis TaxID=1798228 RepID=A0A1I2JNK5_9ACTN|nr:branched-chain amino acid ABC transporter permease [Blastococcus sp. DSM 46838]SFF54727.1 amino acid/amide ABC transporter membrane protein 2, HAAT family [Blastococcus sp. DSM 46838]